MTDPSSPSARHAAGKATACIQPLTHYDSRSLHVFFSSPQSPCPDIQEKKGSSFALPGSTARGTQPTSGLGNTVIRLVAYCGKKRRGERGGGQASEQRRQEGVGPLEKWERGGRGGGGTSRRSGRRRWSRRGENRALVIPGLPRAETTWPPGTGWGSGKHEGTVPTKDWEGDTGGRNWV